MGLERDESAFEAISDGMGLAPDDLVMIVSSYFDESYADDNDLLCVAGYTFSKRNARLLDRDWRKMLRQHKNLPFFRMSACNAHKPPFDRLSEAECDVIAREAIALIHKYAAFGTAITIEQKAFYKIVTRKGFVSSPYEFCIWMGLTNVKPWVDVKFPAAGMAFFFEAGFRDKGSADHVMKNMFATPSLKDFYNYKGHAFIPKEQSCPTQAADLLAWQWFKHAARQQNGLKTMRGDLKALLAGVKHYYVHLNAEGMQSMVDGINAKAGSPIGNEIAGIVLKNPKTKLISQIKGEPGDPEEYEKLKLQYPDRFKAS